MAAITTVIAVASLAVGVIGGIQQHRAQGQAADAARDAAAAQKRMAREQEAVNAQRAAQERRQQIREERVRRAQILQSSENLGTGGSSGEFGALSSLTSTLSSNIGANTSSLASASRISALSQQSADAQSRGLQAQNTAQMWGQVSGFGKSIFSQAGGFNTLATAFSSKS